MFPLVLLLGTIRRLYSPNGKSQNEKLPERPEHSGLGKALRLQGRLGRNKPGLKDQAKFISR